MAGHVLAAPDKFKGSLTAADVAEAVTAGVCRVRPGVAVQRVHVADGGDGTVAAALASGYDGVPVRASGPTGAAVDAEIAVREGTAVVELAIVSGLALLERAQLAPLTASSYGTGELIRAAVQNGARTIVLGVGGSASTDGGAGMLAALGARILDEQGKPLPYGGGALAGVSDVDLSTLDEPVRHAQIILASDVTNPLLGEQGAAHVYGPQKGASADDVARLDAALARWACALVRAGGADVANMAGAGAAGGVGFAALSALGAECRPGADVLLELVGFADQLRGAQLVITGEGSLDEQTLHGKAPMVVAQRARAAGVPVLAVAGRCALPGERLRAAGFEDVYALTDVESDAARSMHNAGPLLEQLGTMIATQWLCA